MADAHRTATRPGFMLLLLILLAPTLAHGRSAEKTPNQQWRACKSVALYENRGKLHELFAKSIQIDRTEANRLFLMEKDEIRYDYVSHYVKADLDADGTVDQIAITTEGTMSVNEAHIRFERGRAKGVTHYSEYHIGNHFLSLLQVQARYYLLASSRRGLSTLYRFDRNATVFPVCWFEMRPNKGVQPTRREPRAVDAER